MMAFGSGVKAVDSFGGDDQCGVKTKSDFGGAEIVVDGFGGPTTLTPLVKKSRAMCCVPSPPVTIMASTPRRRAFSMHKEE
jgi:hypothetical protein